MWDQVVQPNWIIEGIMLFVLTSAVLYLGKNKKFKRFFIPTIPESRKNHYSRIEGNRYNEEYLYRGGSIERFDYFASMPQSMVFGQVEGKSPAIVRSEKNNSVKNKRDEYYAKHIVPYTLNLNDAKTEGGKYEYKDHTAYQLVDSIIYPLFNRKRPQMVIVEGKVGSGKTTLAIQIASIIQHYNDAGSKASSPDSIIIYIDIRKLLRDYFEGDEAFYKYAINYDIHDQVKSILDAEILNLLKQAKVPNLSSDISLNEATNIIYKQLHLRLIIIIDEVDFLYTDFSRRIACLGGYPSPQFIKAYHKIFQLVLNYRDCLPESKSSNLNTVVIVSARSNSLKLFSEFGSQVDITGAQRIAIKTHNNDKAKNIFLTKIKANLADTAISKEKRCYLEELAEEVRNDNTSYEKNLNVSVHGLRHLINIMVRLSSQDESGRLFREVFSKPSLLRLYQYLDGCSNYSQANQGISNIFLVNSDAERESRENNPVLLRHFDSSLLSTHLHSYWMKYLICNYLVHLCNSHNDSIPFDKIVTAFTCRKDDEKHTAYEVNVVILALINASKVDHGRLMKFKSCDALEVMPTNRVLYLFSERMFWEFGYLMIIIEDKWLEFPNQIRKIFEISGKPESSYNFVTSFHASSEPEKYDFVKYKAELVMTFYDLLEVSFWFEKIRYNKVFHQLEAVGIDVDNIIPDKSLIENSIISFTRKFLLSSDVTKISGYLIQDRKKSDERRIAIRHFYEQYYGYPTIRSMESHMKQYYAQL